MTMNDNFIKGRREILMEKKPTTSIEWLGELNIVLNNISAGVDNKDVSTDKAFSAMAALLKSIQKEDKSVWWAGNGGSAAVCSHLAQDLLNKVGIKSVYLGETSLITCMANDYGYEQIYARPLSILAQPGDLLFAISSSGNSANILNAISTALKKNMKVVILSGFDKNNKMNQIDTGIRFYVPSDIYGIVEIAHEAIIHSMIETLDAKVVK